MVRMVMLMRGSTVRLMFMTMSGTIAFVGMVVVMLEGVGMIVVMVMSVLMLLVVMLMGMFVLMVMIVAVGMLVRVFSLAHNFSPYCEDGCFYKASDEKLYIGDGFGKPGHLENGSGCCDHSGGC
jgi:hypothetical protein